MDKGNDDAESYRLKESPTTRHTEGSTTSSVETKEQTPHDDSSSITQQPTISRASSVADFAYEGDLDDDSVFISKSSLQHLTMESAQSRGGDRNQSERDHIYELFHPWALKTYGDQAKTKTITLRKKTRILKALEGKEHSRPDSSKFRFWVKSKGFTTRRPDNFEEAPGSRYLCKTLPPNAVLSENAGDVDLFVMSTNKEHGKRIYRKVAVVEEFFDIIYNVHMELGGRSGMHAGQKRTYRIISETYAFLPREAVTRFLSICPECKKNLRGSPTACYQFEEATNESSSEIEALNYASVTESFVETSASQKSSKHTALKRCNSSQREAAMNKDDNNTNVTVETATPLPRPRSNPTQSAMATSISTTASDNQSQKQLPTKIPRIRINPLLQRPLTPPLPAGNRQQFESQPLLGTESQAIEAKDSLMRYYEFMSRFYAGGLAGSTSLLSQQKTLLSLLSNPSVPPLGVPFFAGRSANSSALLQPLRLPFSNLSKDPFDSASTFIDTLPSSLKRLPEPVQKENNKASCSHVIEPQVKKFKTTHDALQGPFPRPSSISSPLLATASADAPHTETSAINLTKSLFSRSNGTPPPQPPPKATSTPTVLPSPVTEATKPIAVSIKTEMVVPPRSAEIRTPHFRGVVAPSTSTTQLPPLDWERLKPITATYLQLTRSMGLSDEDALRFDNLVSKDSDYDS